PPAAAPAARPAAIPTTRIDTAGIRQRILSINVPVGDYGNLSAGPANTVFYMETLGGGNPGATQRLQRYQVKERTGATFLEGIREYVVSADRKKLLYAAGQRWGIVGTDKPAKAGDGAIDVTQLETLVDPRVEWAEIFKEAWRTQRDYFYDAKMHGTDWQAISAKYTPLLAYVNHRTDLTYLIAQTGGELTVG